MEDWALEEDAMPSADAASPPPESKPALPPGRSTPQSDADAAHYYSFKEEPPNPD